MTVIPLAAAAGTVAALVDVSPTGQPTLDRVLTGIAVALVTWTAAAAHWWALLIGSGLVMATVGDPLFAGLALIPFGLSLWIGSRNRSQAELRSATAGLILNIALHSELGAFTGSSALIGVGVGSILLSSGVMRRSRVQRRWIITSILTSIGLGILSGGALAASAFSVRGDLIEAIDDVRDGIELVSDGDVDVAATRLREAARLLERVNDRIDASWTQTARVVPVLAQHRRSAAVLTDAAADLARVIGDELDVIELDALKPVMGRIDVSAVDRAGGSIDRLVASLDNLLDSIDESRSVWLAPNLTEELDNLVVDLDEQAQSARRAQQAVRLAPNLLGVDETRRYFIAFTTPAEARGGGGFMGSWAEIEIDNGTIDLTRSGRTGDLNSSGSLTRSITEPTEFLDRYGAYGFTSGPDGTTAPNIWSVVNLSPHFPSTAEVITQLYPQSGGSELDGVFSLDVFALARLIEFTGPITVEGLNQEIDGDNAAQFLLYDQYRLDGATVDRVDVLESVTREVVTRLLNGAIPEPRKLIRTMSPMVDEGRLVGYAVDPDEQDLLSVLNMTGSLENPATGDVLALSFNNASASKLELFLDANLAVTTVIEPDGRAESSVTVQLTNSAPTSDWPSGVIGNYVGLPSGHTRLWVSLTSRMPAVAARLDGTPISTAASTEHGLHVSDWFVDIAPGESVTLSVQLKGSLVRDDDPEKLPLVLRLPPLVRPMSATVTYDDRSRFLYSASFDRPGTFR